MTEDRRNTRVGFSYSRVRMRDGTPVSAEFIRSKCDRQRVD